MGCVSLRAFDRGRSTRPARRSAAGLERSIRRFERGRSHTLASGVRSRLTSLRHPIRSRAHGIPASRPRRQRAVCLGPGPGGRWRRAPAHRGSRSAALPARLRGSPARGSRLARVRARRSAGEAERSRGGVSGRAAAPGRSGPRLRLRLHARATCRRPARGPTASDPTQVRAATGGLGLGPRPRLACRHGSQGSDASTIACAARRRRTPPRSAETCWFAIAWATGRISLPWSPTTSSRASPRSFAAWTCCRPPAGRSGWRGCSAGRSPPRFTHHPLVMRSATEKLSKSDGDTGIRDCGRRAGRPERGGARARAHLAPGAGMGLASCR